MGWRDQPVVRQIGDQLLARPSIPSASWGTTERAEFARFLGNVIADEIGWPNSHFVPDDPLEILMFSPVNDGGEILAIDWAVEQRLGHPTDWPDVETFGQLVDGYLDQSRANRTGSKPNINLTD